MKNWKWIFGVAACVTVLVGALFIKLLPWSDLVWVQHKTVTVKSSGLEQCVISAAIAVPGISVEERAPDAEIFARLKIPIRRHPIAVLKHESENTIDIEVWGNSGTEPQKDRDEITPVLDKIQSSIVAKCGKG